MKKQIFICMMISLSALVSKAQQSEDMAMNNMVGSKVKRSETTKEMPVNRDTTRIYVYQVYGYIPTPNSAFEEEHYLGGALSAKWNTFNQTYTHVYDVKVGFTNSAVEISKPSVYNAVIKVNNYFKKAVKKGMVTREEATRSLSHIFDCANVICFNPNTTTFEHAAEKTKTPEEIIGLFEKVRIEVVK